MKGNSGGVGFGWEILDFGEILEIPGLIVVAGVVMPIAFCIWLALGALARRPAGCVELHL